MSAAGLLDVQPKDLRFRADSKKQPPTVLYLTNSSTERVAFKVKTTAPKKYCVKPSADVVEPNATMEVKVFIQQSKEAPVVAGDCRDKFLIQSTPVPPDWSMKTEGNGSTSASDVFNKKDNSRLVEEKLKVTLERPPAPPSPVPEASETTEFAQASPTTRGLTAAGNTGTSAASGGRLEQLESENRSLREKVAMATLRGDESAAAAKAGHGIGRTGGGGGTVTLVHLVLVAIISYILGLYLH